jgi:hypothetical protein
LHLLAVVAMVWAVPLTSSRLSGVAVRLADAPMLSIYPVLAGRYWHGGPTANALSLTTVMSFVTLLTLLWALVTSGWPPLPPSG